MFLQEFDIDISSVHSDRLNLKRSVHNDMALALFFRYLSVKFMGCLGVQHTHKQIPNLAIKQKPNAFFVQKNSFL